VAERYGMIFVVPTSGATLDIDAFLGPVLQDLGYFGFDDFVADLAHETTHPFNWKLHMDATLEMYHIPYLHSRTAGGLDFQATGPHRYERPHLRMVLPLKSLMQFKQKPQHLWHLPSRSALIWFIFPNTTIFFMQGIAHVTSLFPVDADHCRLSSTMVGKSGEDDERQKQRLDIAHKGFWAIMEEDHLVCDSIQAAAHAGGVREYVLGKFEAGVTRFHATLDDALDHAFVAPGVTFVTEESEPHVLLMVPGNSI
jgi:phenylpropionate dioxygenase-like ring-hydroxylating dioxygenase large terminal subunit